MNPLDQIEELHTETKVLLSRSSTALVFMYVGAIGTILGVFWTPLYLAGIVIWTSAALYFWGYLNRKIKHNLRETAFLFRSMIGFPSMNGGPGIDIPKKETEK